MPLGNAYLATTNDEVVSYLYGIAESFDLLDDYLKILHYYLLQRSSSRRTN